MGGICCHDRPRHYQDYEPVSEPIPLEKGACVAESTATPPSRPAPKTSTQENYSPSPLERNFAPTIGDVFYGEKNVQEAANRGLDHVWDDPNVKFAWESISGTRMYSCGDLSEHATFLTNVSEELRSALLEIPEVFRTCELNFGVTLGEEIDVLILVYADFPQRQMKLDSIQSNRLQRVGNLDVDSRISWEEELFKEEINWYKELACELQVANVKRPEYKSRFIFGGHPKLDEE